MVCQASGGAGTDEAGGAVARVKRSIAATIAAASSEERLGAIAQSGGRSVAIAIL